MTVKSNREVTIDYTGMHAVKQVTGQVLVSDSQTSVAVDRHPTYSVRADAPKVINAFPRPFILLIVCIDSKECHYGNRQETRNENKNESLRP